MEGITEIKAAYEAEAKSLATLRGEFDSFKGKLDGLDAEKLNRLSADYEAKSAETARAIDEIRTALARPNGVLAGKSADVLIEAKSAFETLIRNPNDAAAKSAILGFEHVKSINTETGLNGGYAVPTVISNHVAEVKVATGALRRLADVVSVTTPNWSQLIDQNDAGYEWVSETGPRTVTANPTFDKIVPKFGTIAAKVPVTMVAIEDGQPDIVGWVLKGIAKAFARAESKAFISGNPADGECAGLLSAGSGLTTFASGVAADLGGADKLLQLTDEIDSGYHEGAVYLMNRKTKTRVALLKNTDGDYIFKNSVVAGVAPTLWGYNVELDDNMPNVAAGATPVVFGNFRDGFLIADRVGMSFLQDPFTSLGYINMVARKRVGSTVKDAKALKGLKIEA